MDNTLKRFIKLNIWLVIVLFLIRFIISKLIFEPSFNSFYSLFSFASEAIAISETLMFVYNKWAWKISFINFFNKHPILYNQYKGKICFTWNKKQENREVKVTIKQTYLMLNIVFTTKESTSESINAHIDYINNVPNLLYLYINKPDLNVREKSPMHFGHARFKLNDTKKLEGEYFTDRKTVGKIMLKAII